MPTSPVTTMQPNGEKWIGLAAGVAASVLPHVISAVRNRRKDFAPEVMPAAPAGTGNGDATDAEQKWVAALARAVIPAAISAAPGIINAVRGRGKDAEFPVTGGTPAHDMGAEDAAVDEKSIAMIGPHLIRAIMSRRKDFAPEVMPAAAAGNGADSDAEQKWVAALARAVIPAAISAAPGIINAVRGRGKDAAVELPAAGGPATGGMGAEDAEGEEKWLGLAAGVAASVLPHVISAVRNRRKDFAPEVMPATPAGAGNGNGDDADAEQKWVAALARAVIPAAIEAAPGLINAVRGRGKDAVVAPPAPSNAEPEGDEKWLGLVAGVAASVLPQVIGAIRRRKDFAPETETAATGPEAGNGDAADAEQKWVAALARAVIPAAISAAPGLINAVRGKDFVHYPAPAPAGQQQATEGFTAEDEKILRAVAPAIAATMPAVAQAMRGGTDHRYRAAI
jgi:hypothetical protein